MKRLWLAVGAVALVAVLWLGIRLRELMGLLLWSAVLAYLLLPLARRWERLLPRGAAAGAAMGTVLLAGGVLAALAVPVLLSQLEAMAARLPELVSWLRTQQLRLESWLSGQLGLTLAPAGGDGLQGAVEALLHRLGEAELPDAAALGNVLLIPLLACYMLADRELLAGNLMYLIPLRWRGEAAGVMERIHAGLGGYVRGQLWVAALVGTLTGLGLQGVGVPYALLLGLGMAAANMIPYIGPVLGAVPIALTAAAEGPVRLLAAMAVCLAVQQADNLIISPRIMGSSLRMRPLPVLVSVLAGGMLAGAAGMILALPVLIALREWFMYIMDKMTMPVRERERLIKADK